MSDSSFNAAPDLTSPVNAEPQVSQVQYLPDISLDFPEIPQSVVTREHILQLIEDRFDSASVVVVDGKESSGKTTLLAQFSLRYPRTAISLFIRPINTLFYTLNSIKYDLCNQIW